MLPAPIKNKPYQLQHKPASTKDISCLSLPYSPQPFLILSPERDERSGTKGGNGGQQPPMLLPAGSAPWEGVCVCVHVCCKQKQTVLYSEGRLGCGRLRILTCLSPPSAPVKQKSKESTKSTSTKAYVVQLEDSNWILNRLVMK